MHGLSYPNRPIALLADLYSRTEGAQASRRNVLNADQREQVFQNSLLRRSESIRSLTDCHCHLHEKEFNNDRLKQRVGLWNRIGINHIIAVSMNHTSIKQTMLIYDRSITENWPISIYPAIGIHPWEAHKEFEIDLLTDALNKLPCPIVGEIGLDHRFVPEKRWNKQSLVFEQMLQLAEERSAPVIVHSKDAEAQVLDLLVGYLIPKIVLHWYTGPLSLVNIAIERGYYFSITPAIEYSHVLKYLAQNAPLEQLLLESDGPVGYRLPWGRIRGTPSWIPMIARQISQLRNNKSIDSLIQIIEFNTKSLLGKRN
ncbi:MAG: TatD family hydrolase [Candidatus Heimdallarchaeota archaeon]